MTTTTTTVPMDDSALFSSAMAETPAETPAAEPEPAAQPQPEPAQPETTDRPRDEQGRFAPKTEQPQPEAKPETPAQPDQPATPDNEAAIPPWRLREEAEARRAADQRADAVERERAELAVQLRNMQRQIAQLTEKPQPTPDFFEQPGDAVLHTVAPHLQQLQSTMLYNSRLTAGGVYGTDYHKVINAPNIYEAAVRWHKAQNVRQRIGDDLDGFLAKYEEEKLNDPAFMAKVGERLRAQNGQPVVNGQRPAPVVQLPPSFNKIPSAAPNTPEPVGDMSDASLFAHALSR